MIVTEACNRTLTATGSASFPYADKILTGWKENGVRTLQDVETLDKRRQEKQAKKSGTASRTDPEHIDEPVQTTLNSDPTITMIMSGMT